MRKRSVQKQTHRTTQKHVEQQDATKIQTKMCFADFLILFMIYLMISSRYRLGTVNDFHWGFKPFSAIANLSIIYVYLSTILFNIY